MNTNRLRPGRVRLIQLFLSIFPWGCTLTTLSFFLLVPASMQAQQCTFRGNFTTTGPAGQFNNNTANPNCNAFALTWNTTGYTAISIQIEGSDNLSTWTAYSGASTVVVGTNPSTALSGTIKISASSKIAYVRVNLVSATGTGAVNWQVFGYSGTSAGLGLGGGSGGSVTTVTASNPIVSSGGTTPDISCPTCTTGGVTAVTATTPLASSGGATPVISIPVGNLSTVDGSTKLVSWNGVAPTNGDCAFWLNGDLKDSGAGCGVLNPNFSSIVGGTNTVAAMLVGSGASLGPTGTGTVTATQVPTAAGATATTNGQIIYDTTNNNLHGAKNGADAVLLQTTATTAGNGNCANWVNSGGSLKIGDAGAPCGSGSGGGGGVLTYSGPTLSILSGTAFCPVGGGGACSATETNVDIDSSAVSTVSNMYVQLSQALGAGNSVVVTWRKNAASQTVTCTISGASATSCNDTTHSFAVAQADLLDYQLVFAGTIVVTPTITVMSQFGTVNAGVTSVFGNVGPTVGATGDIGATGKVLGVNGVPLCTGFTPTTGQNLQYTTASSPNPCYTAATGGSTVSYSLPYGSAGGNSYDWNLDTVPSGSFTQVNFGTSTVVTTAGSALHLIWQGTGAENFRGYLQNVPASTYTLVMHCRHNIAGGCGIGLYDGTKARLMFFGTDSQLHLFGYTTVTAPTGIAANTVSWSLVDTWIKLVEDGTHRTWFYSTYDGDYLTFVQEATNTGLTPTQIGAAVDALTTSKGSQDALILSFKLTTP